MNRRERRALTRSLGKLDLAAKARMNALRQAHRRGRKLFHVETLPIKETPAHPFWSGGAWTSLLAALRRARHRTGAYGRVLEPGAGTAAALRVIVGGDAGGLGFLCPACAALRGEQAEGLILRVLERDFGIHDGQRLPASAFAPGERA